MPIFQFTVSTGKLFFGKYIEKYGKTLGASTFFQFTVWIGKLFLVNALINMGNPWYLPPFSVQLPSTLFLAKTQGIRVEFNRLHSFLCTVSIGKLFLAETLRIRGKFLIPPFFGLQFQLSHFFGESMENWGRISSRFHFFFILQFPWTNFFGGNLLRILP